MEWNKRYNKKVVGTGKMHLQRRLFRRTTITLGTHFCFTTYRCQVISDAPSLLHDSNAIYDFYLCIIYSILHEFV